MSAAICMGFSAGFHLFQAVGKNGFEHWQRVDHTGILLLMGGSNVPMIYFGFYGRPVFQGMYLAGTFLAVACASVALSHPAFKGQKGRGARLKLFMAVVLFGWIQLCHDIYLR